MSKSRLPPGGSDSGDPPAMQETQDMSLTLSRRKKREKGGTQWQSSAWRTGGQAEPEDYSP